MEIVLVFSGPGYAIRAEQALLGENVPVKVMPLPPAIRAGCGICLRVPPEDAGRARAALAGKTIPVEQTYIRETQNGVSRYTVYGGGDDGQV